MWLWMTALLVVSLTPSTVEHEGVRVSVSIQSHIYTWAITNLGTPPISSFEIELHNTYVQQAPAGWAIEIDGDRFRALATHEREAIHPNQTKEFTARVSSGGAVLGRIPLTVGFDGALEPLTLVAVWGPVRKPRSMVVLVALTVAGIAVVHALVLTLRNRKTAAGTAPGDG